MHVQVLSSGSKGNSTLVRAGETALLVDSGLSGKEMRARLSTAGMGPRSLDHLLITHAQSKTSVIQDVESHRIRHVLEKM